MRALPNTAAPGTLLALLLAACSGGTGESPAAAAGAGGPGQTAPATADLPADGVPGDVPSSVDPAMPAPGSIRFDGFGTANFGTNAEAVRIAWGQDLGSVEPESPQACHYLFPQPAPQGRYRIAFMIEGGEFRRLDVGAVDILAPGGGRVGMVAEEIAGLYAGRVERRPHKYVEGGEYLRIADASGAGALVFATDAAGTVTEWRVGLPPQVDYVEGCS
jgi:hypothetical protein